MENDIRAVALTLIARGLMTPAQAADLAGVSRQLVHFWLKQEDIRWQAVHQARLATLWRNEIAAINGRIIKHPTKRGMRRRATEAKVEWDALEQKRMAALKNRFDGH